MRLIERLELRNAEGCYDRVVLVEDLVDGAGNVPVREIDDHVLITAAFGVGGASSFTTSAIWYVSSRVTFFGFSSGRYS